MEFDYVATDRSGRQVRGRIDAASERSARSALRKNALTPVKLKSVHLTGAKRCRSAVAPRELVLLTRQLATLTSAALPLDECLLALMRQAQKTAVRDMLSALHQKIREGTSFADALTLYPAIFSPVYRATVQAGEAAGKLDVVLVQLADHTERSWALKSKMTQAMIYPALLMMVAIVVVSVLLTAVVPQITSQFINMGHELPFATRLLIAISDGMRDVGPYFLGVISVTTLCVALAIRSPDRKKTWHRLLTRLPLIGTVVRDLAIARYARTLSILTAGAVPLLHAMGISAAVITNLYLREALDKAVERVREGSTLTQALSETGLFSPMMQHMIGSGEKSGELQTLMNRAAELQETQFAGQMTILMAVSEPLLVITMAGVVLFIILAILQPILQLNSLIG
ncbi:type II secretion system inner membrane protein GspF [Pantoea sp. SORGH_AS_0659]|uniref:type II secretion system inner membrane protein GspF n=1 Tax=Pantoea sp. SORGH_AS_0659 TaxID=3062597 RepID=UPI002860B960|nr:type II secretion system inner membrane protein GspF [Pantoea sp. SORGH_AS_0659]MDR6352485.1 general secretion pathway protein F [Pantoea sp. SORGH_AS_0659]